MSERPESEQRKIRVRQRMLRHFFSSHELRQAAPRKSYTASELRNWGFIGIRHELQNWYVSSIQITSNSWSGRLDAEHIRWLQMENQFDPLTHYNLPYWFVLKDFLDTLPKTTSLADLSREQWKLYLMILLSAPKNIKRGSREMYRKWFNPTVFDIIFPPHLSSRYVKKEKRDA